MPKGLTKENGVVTSKVNRDAFFKAMAPESQFYVMLDHLPGVSFFAKDKDFRMIAANQQFIERFGCKEESEMIGKDDFSLFPPRLAENFRRDDEEIMRTGEPKLNIMELFFNRTGIPDWFITNKLPIFDRKRKVIGIMGITQSYEGRKQVLQPYLQIDRAVEWIRSHFRERITVEELASMVFLSPRQMHRKFVESFGSSPQAFILKLRIQAACDALQHEGKQISEVAREVGFGDQSTFTQHFHKHMGLTPLKYQQQFRLIRKG